MIRLILLVFVAIVVLVTGVSVTLYHFYGWKGLIAVPFVLIALIWVVKKVGKMMFQRFALKLFSAKSGVLRGATMEVHSIAPVSKPAFETAPDEDGEPDEVGDEEPTAEVESDEEKPQEYFAADVTITPRNPGDDSVWEPTELILTSKKITSLMELGDDDASVGNVEKAEIWNGSEFGPDDPGKYPGQQRLRLTFAVTPGTKTALVHYYNEPIGTLNFPPWSIEIPATVTPT